MYETGNGFTNAYLWKISIVREREIAVEISGQTPKEMPYISTIDSQTEHKRWGSEETTTM